MGIIWSRQLRKPQRKDYERELAELDGQIQRFEVDLAETRVSERKTSVYLFFYSLLLMLCLFLLLILRPLKPFISASLIVAVPLALFNVRKVVLWYYKRKIGNSEEGLQALRAKQKLKIEELKDETSYYRTRGLIERFDPDLRRTSPFEMVH